MNQLWNLDLGQGIFEICTLLELGGGAKGAESKIICKLLNTYNSQS